MSFLIPLIALITGILLGDNLKLPVWGIIPVSLAIVYYGLVLKKSSIPSVSLKYKKHHLIWIFLLFCGIGMLDISFNRPDFPSEDSLKGYVVGEGEIIDVKTYANGDKLLVKVYELVDSDRNIRKYNDFRITILTKGFSADIGDIITFPPSFVPIIDNPNFRASGYAQRMKRKGISYNINVGENEIKIKGFNNTLLNSAVAWRNRIISKVEKSSLSRPAMNFIIAMIFGDRSFINEETRSSFSNAGVAHILALSGMHVAIIMGILLILLFPLKLLGWHRFRYWIAIVIIWIYAFFTGLSPSTVRACIMTTFVVIAWSIERKNSSENALLAAAFVILIVNPEALFDIGMQLSFLCVGSILIFADTLNPVNRHYHPYLHSTVSIILVSLVATITTWVIISYYFSNIPLLFLPVNLCLLPLLPVFMWLALIYIILLLFNIDWTLLGWLIDKSYELFEWIVTTLSGNGYAVINYRVQLPIVILWLLGILIIAFAIKKKKNIRKTLMAGGLSMLALSLLLTPFLKENQSDSVIFQRGLQTISVALYNGDDVKISQLPRNTVSRICHKGCDIFAIDCAVNIDSLSAQLIKSSNKKRKRFLIIGSGFRGHKLNELPRIKDFDKIILHSSIKRKMESDLKRQALDSGIRNIYSLREDGPLEEFLPDTLLVTR